MLRRYALLALTFAALIGALPAQTSCPDLAEEVLKLDDFDQAQDAFQDAFKAVLKHELEPTALSEQQKDELMKLVPEIISGQKMAQSARGALKQRCDVALLTSVRDTLASPLARKMSEMEQAVRTPEGRARADRYMKTLSMQSPRESRMDLIRQLSAATHSSEYAFEMLTTISKGFHEGLQSSTTEADLAALQRLRPSMEEWGIARDFYTYLHATDDELKAYIALMADPSMRRYVRILKDSVVRSANSQSILLAQRFKKELERIHP